MAQFIPQSQQFTPQVYTPLYMQIDDAWQTEIHEITIHQISGSQDVTTIMREWAGVSKGSGRTECSFQFRVPYMDTDSGGIGFNTAGDTTGQGVPLQNTMVTNGNLIGGKPVKFSIALGNPAVQKYVFKGYIKDIQTNYSDGSVLNTTVNCTGQLQYWGAVPV